MNVPLKASDDDGHFRHPVASKGDQNASNVGTNRLKENAKGDFHNMTSHSFFLEGGGGRAKCNKSLLYLSESIFY